MAQATPERIIIKLSYQLLKAEEERDQWQQRASSLERQLALFSDALADSLKDAVHKDKRLEDLQGRLFLADVQIAELNNKLLRTTHLALATKASLRAGGQDSHVVNAMLSILQKAEEKSGGDMLGGQTSKDHSSPQAPLTSPTYWDDTTSSSASS